MAYHDGNGRLMIDGQAADRDIRRLKEAVQALTDSRAGIRSLRARSAGMKGQAAQAIQEKSLEMEKRLTQAIGGLEETAAYIRKVVDRYQKIDEEAARTICQAAAQAAAQAGVARPQGREPIPAENGMAGAALAACEAFKNILDRK